jgi:site-specific DNA-methyltransferase (adenine-specific)
VSVKAGKNISLTMLKDLIATVQSNDAKLGLFATLSAPPKPMIAEAAKAGYYTSPVGISFPKIQILTVQGLMHGTEHPQYPVAMGALRLNDRALS